MSWHRPHASMSRLSTKRQAESFLCCPQGLLCPAHHPGRGLSSPAACPGWFGVSAGLMLSQMQAFMNSAAPFHSPKPRSLLLTWTQSPHLSFPQPPVLCYPIWWAGCRQLATQAGNNASERCLTHGILQFWDVVADIVRHKSSYSYSKVVTMTPAAFAHRDPAILCTFAICRSDLN